MAGRKGSPDHAALAAALEMTDIDAVAALVAAADNRELAAGEQLAAADSPWNETVYIVSEGELELKRPTGETQRLTTGGFFGLANYLDGGPFLSGARAVGRCRLLVVPAARLKELERGHPALSRAINRRLAARLRRRRPSREIKAGLLSRPVRSLMKSPLSTCNASLSLREAFATMDARRIGSLGALNERGDLVGVLTYAGLCRALLGGADPDGSVLAAACEQPVHIGPDEPLWRAEDRLARHDVKYLVVTDGSRALGMLSQTDLLRGLLAEGAAGDVVTRIRHARDIAALAQEYGDIGEHAERALEYHRRAGDAVRSLSELHLAIQRRCAFLVEQDMKAAGKGAAPGPYVLLIMGSGGRREMFLNPDQDNGLLWADTPELDNDAARGWFEEYARRLNAALDRIGYVLCPGEIMARNPAYRGSLMQWRERINRMAALPGEAAARWSNIVFDFDTLTGSEVLTRMLREHVNETVRRSPGLLAAMTAHDAEGTAPLGLFNRLVTSDEPGREGTIDLKRNGLRIISDAARIFGLGHGVTLRNTTERLNALVHVGALDADLAESAVQALDELQGLVLAHQVGLWRAGKPVNSLIELEKLNSHRRSALRASLRVVKRLQEELQGRYRQTAF